MLEAMRFPGLAVAAGLLGLAGAGPASAQAVLEAGFSGLGSLPDAAQGSTAFDLSADGLVAVGVASSGASVREAWRWTETLGIQGLGFLPGESTSTAASVSADGAFIAGWSGPEAFRWSIAGLEPVATAIAGEVQVVAISEDGGTIVGDHLDLDAFEGISWRWRSGTGIDTSFHFPVEDLFSFLNTSADGEIVAGAGGVPDDTEVFRYTDAGTTSLPSLPVTGSTCQCGSRPYGMSGDGSAVVGFSHGEAFRWTEASGTLGVGFVFDGIPQDVDAQLSTARDVSADGSVVVGYGEALFSGQSRAFVWTPATGIRDLREVLVLLGLGPDLSGWQLTEAVAVSADGRTILGNGVGPSGKPEAWIAVVPVIPAPEVALPTLDATTLGLLVGLLLLCGRRGSRGPTEPGVDAALSTPLPVVSARRA